MKIIRYGAFFLVLVTSFTVAMLYYGSTHKDLVEDALGMREKASLSLEEEARQKALQEERALKRRQEEAAKKELNARIEKLKEGMESVDAGLYTWYSYKEETDLLGGLYFFPLLGHGSDCTFRCKILYYYSIHEGSFRGWIFGDRFSIEADGTSHTWELDEKKRRDHLGEDVEFLKEQYQFSLGKEGEAVLRRAAYADIVTCSYWSSSDGTSVSCTLTDEEKRRLQKMIALYDLWQESSWL